MINKCKLCWWWLKQPSSVVGILLGANYLTNLAWQSAWQARKGAPSLLPHGYPSLEFMIDNFTLSFRNLREGRWWTLFTHTISNVSIESLVFSSVDILISGHNICAYSGPSDFLFLYFAGGAVETLLQMILNKNFYLYLTGMKKLPDTAWVGLPHCTLLLFSLFTKSDAVRMLIANPNLLSEYLNFLFKEGVGIVILVGLSAGLFGIVVIRVLQEFGLTKK